MEHSKSDFVDGILERISSGVPFDAEELDTLLDDVNCKLEDVSNRLEEGNNELQVEIKLVESDYQSNACHSDSLALQCLLTNVIQALERNTGFEDYILKDLISFCFRNTISLPPLHDIKTRYNGVTYGDSDSLHTIIEKTEEENQLLWSKICQKFKTGFLNLIKDLPLMNSKELYKQSALPSYSKFVQERQTFLLQQLLCIFSQEAVVDMIYELRQIQIEDNGSSSKECSVTFTDETSACIHRSIKILGKVVSNQVCMMHNDMILLNSIFPDEEFVSSSMRELLKIYSENIRVHVETFKDCYNRIPTPTGLNFEFGKDKSKDNKFTTTDLRNFSKVFYILHCWSTNVSNIINHSYIQDNLKDVLDTISVASSLEMLISENSFERKLELWNWKELFVSYVSVFKKAIPSYIHCVCNIVIESRKSEKDKELRKLVYVNDNLLEGNPECPVQVTNHCGTLVSLLNEMILFSIPDDQDLFKDLYSATLTGLLDGLNIHNSYFEELLKVFQESQSDIETMYNVISDLSLMVVQLKIWDIVISSEKRKNILHIIISNAQNTLSRCVAATTKYHLDVLKSSLVYDYHGNNWGDDKPFFEGERCSFTVQMWSYYMQGVVYDMKTKLPVKYTKQILWDICVEMLVFFTSRYSGVKPSYRRQKQFKCDILVLLSSFKWLLLHVIDNLQHFKDMDNVKTELWHTLCKQLLDVMIVTSSPLENVCCYLENTNSCQQNDVDKNRSGNWYNHTNIYKLSEFSSCVMLDILVKQRNVDWSMMAQLLIRNKSQLSIALVEYADYLKQPVIVEQNPSDINMNAMFCSKINITLEPLVRETLVADLVTLFLRLPRKSFINFMASLIKEDHSKSFKVQNNDQLTLWLRVVSIKLQPVIARILNPALDLLLAESKYKASPSFAFTKLKRLPCGCPTINQTDEDKFLSGTNLLHKCLMVTLEALVDSASLLPSRIWDLLVYVKGEPSFAQSWIKQDNLGTKVLACLLYNWLMTRSNLQQHGVTFSSETCENISVFAELLWHVVYHRTYDVTDNPDISMGIYRDLQSTGDLITEKLERLHEYFDRNSLTYEVDETVDEEYPQFSVSPINSGNEEEISSLKYIFSVLKANQVKIKEMLQGKEDLQTRLEKENLELSRQLNMEEFNPLHVFQNIGDKKIHHFELLEGELEWNEMIPSVVLPKWKVLIKNRFEFQENADSFLRDDEKEAVAKIKIILEMSEDE